MTYGDVKKLASALLTGDFVFPEDEGEQLMLLSYAYQVVATEADALKLFTVNKDAAILREGPGSMFVRMPDLPRTNTDVLDIDSELGYAVARYMASFISERKANIHKAEASKVVIAYNAKVDAYLTTLAEEEFDAKRHLQ